MVAGTHDYSTARTIDLSKFAAAHGASALLIVPPYYMAPTPAQVMDHYRRIAESVSIPIIVYHNIPLTSVDLTTDPRTHINSHTTLNLYRRNIDSLPPRHNARTRAFTLHEFLRLVGSLSRSQPTSSTRHSSDTATHT